MSESNEKTVKMSLNGLAAAKNTSQQNSKHVNNNDYLKETKMPLRSVAGIGTRPVAIAPIGSGLVGCQPNQHQQQQHLYGILAPPLPLSSLQQRLVGQSRSLLSMNMNNTSLSIIEDKNESSEERSSSAVNGQAMFMEDDNQAGGYSELEPNTSSIFSGGGGGASLSKFYFNFRMLKTDGVCFNYSA